MTPQALDIEITPDDHLKIGNMFAVDGEFAKAAKFYSEALEKRPGDPGVLTSLAFAQLKGGDISNASDNVNRALVKDNKYPFAWNIAGLADEAKAHWISSEDCFLRAIALDATNPAFRMNLAHLYQILGRYPESEATYDKAIEIDPTNLEARFYRSMTALTQGKMTPQNFAEYELRYALYNCPVPKNGHRIWRGEEDLTGKRILLCGEQGLGDCVMCARYAIWLRKHRGTREIVVVGKKEILPVLKCAREVDAVVDDWPAAEPYDYQIAMMSLAGLSLQAHGPWTEFFTPAPWYGECPYLTLPRIDPPLKEGRFRIGFCWKGNPLHGNDKYRSFDKRLFDRLVASSPRRFIAVSLQHNDHHPGMLDCGATSVFELAQYIQELDLIITCDTAIAHLAGAMARPVWTLIGVNNDWRWGQGSDATPWYPSMKLFRAEKPLEWAPVIERVREALEDLLEGRENQ